MKPNLSFLIVASNTSECVFQVIDSLERAVNEHPIRYSYEILISSFDKIEYKNVIWIEDEVKQEGNTIQAYNNMAKHSQGEYLFVLNDDHMFPPSSNPLGVVEYLNSDAFKDRKYKVSGICSGKNTMSYEHRMTATAVLNSHYWNTEPGRFPNHAAFPEELKHPRFNSFEHRYLILGYPVMTREALDKLGCLFNPAFKHHYADNWLPFFLGEIGEYTQAYENTALEWCPRAGSTSFVSNDAYDYEVYCKLAVKLLKGGCSYDENPN